MKSKIQLLIIIIFLTCSSSECEKIEDPKDYITVNVNIEGNFRLVNSTTGKRIIPSVEGEDFRVDVIKAGGEQFNLYLYFEEDCEFDFDGIASFKLYKEQDIKIMAYIEAVPGGYTQIRGIELLTWDEVYPGVDFGGKYVWDSYVEIKWLFN